MTVKPNEAENVVEKDDDKDFDAGFSGAETKKVEAVPEDKEEENTEGDEAEEGTLEASEGGETEAEGDETPAEGENAAKTPSKPEKKAATRLSAAEIESLKAIAAQSPEDKKKLDKAFGTIGELQQQLKTLRANGDARVSGETKPEKPAKVEIDESKLTPGQIVQLRLRERADEDLQDEYPDWRKIVGASKTPDPNHPFRKWLATREQDYQDKVNNTDSSRIIARAIELFHASTKKPPKLTQAPAKAKGTAGEKAAAERRDRIKDTIPPKTAGSVPARSKTPDDEFQEGFRTG